MADYTCIFYVDSDVVLANGKTVNHLVKTTLPVIPPTITKSEEITNVWNEADGRYMNIALRVDLRNFEVSFARSCVLVDLKLEYTTRIKFEGFESFDLPLGEWNGLIESLRQNDIA